MASKGSSDGSKPQSTGADVPLVIDEYFLDESKTPARSELSPQEGFELIRNPNDIPDCKEPRPLGADVRLEVDESRTETKERLDEEEFEHIEFPSSSCVPVSSLKDKTVFPMKTKVTSQRVMTKEMTESMLKPMLQRISVSSDKSRRETSESTAEPSVGESDFTGQLFGLDNFTEYYESLDMPTPPLGKEMDQLLSLPYIRESTASPLQESMPVMKSIDACNLRLVEALMDVCPNTQSPSNEDASEETPRLGETAEMIEPTSLLLKDKKETELLKEACVDLITFSPKTSDNIEPVMGATEETARQVGAAEMQDPTSLLLRDIKEATVTELLKEACEDIFSPKTLDNIEPVMGASEETARQVGAAEMQDPTSLLLRDIKEATVTELLKEACEDISPKTVENIEPVMGMGAYANTSMLKGDTSEGIARQVGTAEMVDPTSLLRKEATVTELWKEACEDIFSPETLENIEPVMGACANTSWLKEGASEETARQVGAAEMVDPTSPLRDTKEANVMELLREACADLTLSSPKKSDSSDSDIEVIEDSTE